MAECPGCFGEGIHDMRDSDALIAETMTDEQIAAAKVNGLIHPVGVVPCPECEGTGVVSEERAKDLRAGAVAFIDQIRAKMCDEDARA